MGVSPKNDASFDHYTAIKAIALYNIIRKPNSVAEVTASLRRWWCHKYNRPYKDPILDTYTFEELLLEYYEVLFLTDNKAKITAHAEIEEAFNADEDEEHLRRIMGDSYVSKEDMLKELEKAEKENDNK